VLANPANSPGEGERTETRVRTASTKVTEAEFAELDAFASQPGQSVSEWIRQTILSEARSQRNSATTSHLFTELVGIQLLLINTLGPLIRGRTDDGGPSQRNPSACAIHKIAKSPRTAGQEIEYGGADRMTTVQQWGRKESIIWPPRGFYYSYAAIFLAVVMSSLLMYVHFRFSFSPLEKYYVPYYIRTELAGFFRSTGMYQLVSNGQKTGTALKRRHVRLCSPALHSRFHKSLPDKIQPHPRLDITI